MMGMNLAILSNFHGIGSKAWILTYVQKLKLYINKIKKQTIFFLPIVSSMGQNKPFKINFLDKSAIGLQICPKL